MSLTGAATVDFETRSTCNLRKSGAWRYSIHPTTEILCLSYRLPYWESGRTALWHPAFPHLGIDESQDYADCVELLEWIEEGGLVEAHGAWFEVSIWTNILAPRFGWPLPAVSQWRCSAAKAASHALPRGLDAAAGALRLRERKDLVGGKVMKKITKPRKSRKKEREAWDAAGVAHPTILWHEDIDVLWQVWQYCRQDVLTEEAVSAALPDLSPEEQWIFELDLTINLRGFQLDPQAVKVALRLIAQETKRLNAELVEITEGAVAKATARAQMLRWLATQDVHLFDTQKKTIDDLLSSQQELPVKARRALEILRTLGQSSTAKYEAMRDWAGADARVRGGLVYHGASTGRWTGSGVQPHNFPKGKAKDVDALWTLLKSGDIQAIAAAYGSVMTALSYGLRGAIVARKGHQLYVADYASIEARVLVWLAGDENALTIFRTGADIYCDMAESIYGYPCNKKDHPTERGLGKIAILGLGYQMGASRFVDTCAVSGITIEEDFAQNVVNAYRDKYWRVKQLWWDQEAAAIQAVRQRRRVMCQGIAWEVIGSFLYATLPSGRRLAYMDPMVRPKTMPWGAVKDQLSYMGVDSYTRQWKRQSTYGGMIVENLVQAISRDLMAAAIARCVGTVYAVVLSVHDELVAEAPLGAGSVHEFERLMATCPDWATGCPVEAEGWVGTRYRK